jgi:hypothetical protein
MKKHTVLTLGLALALPCVGAWAIDNNSAGATPDQGAQLQAPAQQDQNQAQPNTPADQNQAQPNTAPADQNQAQPNNAAPDNTQPNNPPPDNTQPNNLPPNNAPPNNAAPPDQQQPNALPNQQQPSTDQGAGAVNSGTSASPLRQFVGAQIQEVGELSDQIDQFRAANRPQAVLAAYHMIRDHTLAADAARNILARRGEPTEPIFMPMPAMASSPDEMVQHDLQEHQQMLSQLQQMAANASSPQERNLYQKAIDATNKHIGWLNAMSQGQTVQVGFFQPTTPLGMLAGNTATAENTVASGYPQPSAQRVAGYRQQMMPSRVTYRRHRRPRHHRHHRVRYNR